MFPEKKKKSTILPYVFLKNLHHFLEICFYSKEFIFFCILTVTPFMKVNKGENITGDTFYKHCVMRTG